jgi:hypothetical protein
MNIDILETIESYKSFNDIRHSYTVTFKRGFDIDISFDFLLNVCCNKTGLTSTEASHVDQFILMALLTAGPSISSVCCFILNYETGNHYPWALVKAFRYFCSLVDDMLFSSALVGPVQIIEESCSNHLPDAYANLVGIIKKAVKESYSCQFCDEHIGVGSGIDPSDRYCDFSCEEGEEE